MNSLINVLRNKYLPFLFAVPLFFCVHRYDGVVFDAILYVSQYVNFLDSSRFLGDPAFAFGNQGSFGFFSPIFGIFISLFGVSEGAFVYTFSMQFAWIVVAVCMVKCLLRFTEQRLWILPTTILFIAFFANGSSFSHIDFFNYISLYACSRSLSIVLGMIALSFLFSGSRILSLLFILFGAVIHPLTAGWCLPLWLFYFFPKTRWPILIFSLIFPLSCFFHIGVFDFLPADWMPRPLDFSPDYLFFSKILVLLVFFCAMMKISKRACVRNLSVSLCLLLMICAYWNVCGGWGEHIFLYQTQPWRAVWIPSVIAVPLGLSFVKDSLRRALKTSRFFTYDLGLAILIISFLAPSNLLVASLFAGFLFLKRNKEIPFRSVVMVFVFGGLTGYFVQQYLTWCLQGFPPFLGFDYARIYHIRDSFLLFQFFFVIAFTVYFVKRRHFFFAALLVLSIFFSRFILLPALPLFMFLYSKEKRFNYWSGAILITIFILFDGLFDIESRRHTLIEGMPLNFPWICFATIMSFASIVFSRRLFYKGIIIWLLICSVVAMASYYDRSVKWLKKDAQIDPYLQSSIFSQVEERGKMLFYVSGDFLSQPGIHFLTGCYFSNSVMVGAIFNKRHYRTALERSHLLYWGERKSESSEFFKYDKITNKFSNVDTLINRTKFLCGLNEISHLVTDKEIVGFVKEDSTIVDGPQKVYLYACPSKY